MIRESGSQPLASVRLRAARWTREARRFHPGVAIRVAHLARSFRRTPCNGGHERPTKREPTRDSIGAAPLPVTAMPRFSTKPEVFPPVVPAVGDRGDVPTYAFCDSGIILAWTEPDGFLAEQEDRGLGYEISSDKRLVVEVNVYFQRPEKSSQERAIEAAHEEVARLRRVHASHDFSGVVTKSEDRVAPLTVDGVEGLWQAVGIEVVGARSRPPDFTLRTEHVMLPYVVSATKSKLVHLSATRPGQGPDYPIADALACWRGAFTARVPTPHDHEYAAWYFDLGFILGGITSDRGSHRYSDAGYDEPGEGRLGAMARLEALPPQRRSSLDVARDIDASLRRAAREVRFPSTVEVVSREIRCDGSGLVVLDGYEIVAGPEDESETTYPDDPPKDLAAMTEQERYDQENWRFHPGVTIRVAYLALDDEWFTRLTLMAGARAIDRLETSWQQLCERLWVWTR